MPPPATATSIQLALGLNFLRVPSQNLPEEEGPETTPEEQLLDNVVPMSAQYQWLAAQAQANALQFDPGVPDPINGYAVASFIAALNQMLLGLVDAGITYTAATYIIDHVLKGGHWVPGGGNIFKLMANGMPLSMEARVDGVDYQVEILMSVEVIS